MASVCVEKFTTQEACVGISRHVYRENTNYKNQHIDKNLEYLNKYYGDGDMCRSLIHDKITEIDKGMPPLRVKRDRKTVADVCIVAPRENLPNNEVMRFFDQTLNNMSAEYVVVGAAVHADEVHDYYDDYDQKIHTSRLHMHVLVIPETDKGCNMSSWLTKSRYVKLNTICDKVCEIVFGYPYMDGTRRKSRGSVERLKELSMLNAAKLLPELEAKVNNLKAEKIVIENEIEHLKMDAKRVESELKNRMQKAEADLKKYFTPAPQLNEVLEERIVKIGLTKTQTVYIEKNPNAILAAISNTIAVMARNDVLEKKLATAQSKIDYYVRENQDLKDKNVHLNQILGKLKVWEKVELIRAGFITEKMLELKAMGMHIPELEGLSHRECTLLMAELERLRKIDCCDAILERANDDPILHQKLKEFLPDMIWEKENEDRYYER